MLRSCLFAILVSAFAAAQQPSQPQVKVNMLNVCSPSADDQKEISAALARVPKQPLFAQDFEVDAVEGLAGDLERGAIGQGRAEAAEGANGETTESPLHADC